MDSVAEQIARKILSSAESRVVDLANWRKGRKIALEAGLGDDGSALGKLAGRVSCHVRYALGQHVASLIAESIFAMKDSRTLPFGLLPPPFQS